MMESQKGSILVPALLVNYRIIFYLRQKILFHCVEYTFPMVFYYDSH